MTGQTDEMPPLPTMPKIEGSAMDTAASMNADATQEIESLPDFKNIAQWQHIDLLAKSGNAKAKEMLERRKVEEEIAKRLVEATNGIQAAHKSETLSQQDLDNKKTARNAYNVPE